MAARKQMQAQAPNRPAEEALIKDVLKRAAKEIGTILKHRAEAKAVEVKEKVKARVATEARALAKKAGIIKTKAKKEVKAKIKKVVRKKTTPISRGDDLHLIPVSGERFPARKDHAPRIEKEFHHKQEIAFQQENQRMKAAMAGRKNVKLVRKQP